MQKISYLLLFLSFFGWAQRGDFSLEEIEKLREINKKPIMVLFTTDWCAVCQVQKKNLQKVPDDFWERVYYTSINPEKYKREISFLGKKYVYISNGASGLHQVVYDWAGGRVPAYPFWVFIDEKGDFATYEGLLKLNELELVINKRN